MIDSCPLIITNLLTLALPGVILAVPMRPLVLFWIKLVPGVRPPVDLRANCLVASAKKIHLHEEFLHMNNIMLSRLLKFKSTKI